MTPVEILKAARALIERPEHWCRGAVAKDINGRAVSPRSEEARSFCAVGAIMRVAPINSEAEEAAEKSMRAAIRKDYIGGWNDTVGRTHDEVLAGFDAAAALAEKEAQS